MPADATELGRVTASCEPSMPSAGFERLPLGNIDCSLALLTLALEETAETVGANALVGELCVGREPSPSRQQEPERLECSATVAVQIPPRTIGETVRRAAAHDLTRPSALTHFATWVDFQPSGPALPVSAPAMAVEVPRQPAADLLVGTLRLVVTVPTTRLDAVRLVGVAAQRLSAPHFETPYCHGYGKALGLECFSRLYRPEQNESITPRLP